MPHRIIKLTMAKSKKEKTTPPKKKTEQNRVKMQFYHTGRFPGVESISSELLKNGGGWRRGNNNNPNSGVPGHMGDERITDGMDTIALLWTQSYLYQRKATSSNVRTIVPSAGSATLANYTPRYPQLTQGQG